MLSELIMRMNAEVMVANLSERFCFLVTGIFYRIGQGSELRHTKWGFL